MFVVSWTTYENHIHKYKVSTNTTYIINSCSDTRLENEKLTLCLNNKDYALTFLISSVAILPSWWIANRRPLCEISLIFKETILYSYSFLPNCCTCQKILGSYREFMWGPCLIIYPAFLCGCTLRRKISRDGQNYILQSAHWETPPKLPRNLVFPGNSLKIICYTSGIYPSSPK